MTPHIEAKKGEIAKTVIMPGDPKRAKLIAETYLDNYKIVSDVRSISVYTGTYNGKEVTVMASGMGMPSMAIYATELFTDYDVEKIIRVGTCGALKEEIKLNSIFLVNEAYTTSNFAYNYTKENINTVSSSKELNEKIKNQNIEFIKAYTTDVFYNEFENKSVKENNCDVVEMETFALLYIAKHLKKEASSILTVSDNLITKKQLSSSQREQNLKDAIVIALNSL